MNINEIYIAIILLSTAFSYFLLSYKTFILIAFVSLIFSFIFTYQIYKNKGQNRESYESLAIGILALAMAFLVPNARYVLLLISIYAIGRFIFSYYFVSSINRRDTEIKINQIETITTENLENLKNNISEIDKNTEDRMKHIENDLKTNLGIHTQNRFAALEKDLDQKIANQEKINVEELEERIADRLHHKNQEEFKSLMKEVSQKIDSIVINKTAFNDENQKYLIEQLKSIQGEYGSVISDILDRIEVLSQQKTIDNSKEIEKLRLTIKENKEQYEKEIQRISDNHNVIIQNHEIRTKFNEALLSAETELDIISPWITSRVVDDMMIDKFHRLLKKGVKIKILYGIGLEQGSTSKKELNDYRNKKSKEMADKLSNEFKRYKGFSIKRGNTHQKIVLCDDKFYINSSFNYLSFLGEYTESDEDIRTESGECSTDKVLINEYRNRYFSF